MPNIAFEYQIAGDNLPCDIYLTTSFDRQNADDVILDDLLDGVIYTCGMTEHGYKEFFVALGPEDGNIMTQAEFNEQIDIAVQFIANVFPRLGEVDYSGGFEFDTPNGVIALYPHDGDKEKLKHTKLSYMEMTVKHYGEDNLDAFDIIFVDLSEAHPRAIH